MAAKAVAAEGTFSGEAAATMAVEKARQSSATSLDLSFQQLTQLPQGLSSLGSLQALDLRSNQLSGTLCESEAGQQSPGTGQDLALSGGEGQPGLIPAGVRILNLSSNAISDVGWGLLGKSPSLDVLELSNNQLRFVPPPLLACSGMTELHLARNHLEQLPSSLGEALPMLKVLDVSYNSLTKLPDSLGKLKHLESLTARFNQLEKVPLSLGDARALKHLDLSSNFVNLISIPGTLGNLTALTFLDLGNNHITNLPVQLGRLADLQFLGLEGNPLQFPPLEVLSMQDLSVEASSGHGSAKEAAAAKARAQTQMVKAFLAAKLQDWEEQNSTTYSEGAAGSWGAWLGDWPMLQEWIAGLFGSASETPALEGMIVSAVPRAALPAPPEPKYEEALPVSVGISMGVGVSSTRQGLATAEAARAETQRLVPRAGSDRESLAVSQQPEASHTAVPLLEREEREACLA